MRYAEVRLTIRNSLSESGVVVLEPWTTEKLLAPGETIEVVAGGDLSLPLEIELSEDRLILYTFDSEGATLE